MPSKIFKNPILVKKDDGSVALRTGKGKYVEVEKAAGQPGGAAVQVVDNLTSTSASSALSANQGRALKQQVDSKASSAVTVILLNSDRPLAASDNNANLAMTASRSVTVGVGGIRSTFVNSSDSPLNITVTGTSGVIVNGTANGSVTRTIPARGALALQPDDVNSYDLPRVASVEYRAVPADRPLANGDLAVNLAIGANRAFTLPSGLVDGFNTQFSNASQGSVTVTVTPGAGVTLNGATSAVTRTLAAGQTTAILPVSANAYILPGA